MSTMCDLHFVILVYRPMFILDIARIVKYCETWLSIKYKVFRRRRKDHSPGLQKCKSDVVAECSGTAEGEGALYPF